jgi:hypothetical protein
MNDIPDFAEAVQRFRRVLSESGHSDQLFWVFRDDLWQLSVTRVLVKYPPPLENEALAQKVFAEGRASGLVEISAVAGTGHKLAATIWFPKYPHEEVQGWNQGMKICILQPLPIARLVQPLWWKSLRLLPGHRRYQEMASFIGTRDWAGA